MSSDEGFAVMDVSTSLLEDEKFKRLARDYPGLAATGTMGFVSVLAASWRHGKRVQVRDAWPAWAPYDVDAVGALMAVKLLDRTGRLPVGSWRGWFDPACKRRENFRAKWRRANDRRRVTRTNDHRGNRGVTTTDRPSDRPTDIDERVNETSSNGRARHNGRRHLGLVDPVTA